MRLSFMFSRKFWLLSGGGVLAGAMLIVLYIYNPARVHLLPPCFLYSTTGLYCPGCGGTRAMHQLLHGNLAMSLRCNVLLLIILPWLLFLIGRSNGWWPVVMKNLWLERLLIWGVVGLMLVYGLARNLPLWPRDWLPPG